MQSGFFKNSGGSLHFEDPTYVERKADDELFNTLLSGENCYVLNARQTGKTSLKVRVINKLKQQGVKYCSIDLSGIGTQVTIDEWYFDIADEVIASFPEFDEFELEAWWQKNNHFSANNRLKKLLLDHILVEVKENIIFFIDEIDTLLSLNFDTDDFFTLIRFIYNLQSQEVNANRLIFCLLGVASPPNLIRNKTRTSYNIGRSIELSGLPLNNAKKSLVPLLALTFNDKAEEILESIFCWTEGQPFLTQKLCYLVMNNADDLSIDEVVRKLIINNWEFQDEPTHLRTIRDRITLNNGSQGTLLALYHQILLKGEIKATNSPEQTALRLSGLVVQSEGKLKIFNTIYENVFNQKWVEEQLSNIRPYAEAINAWIDSSYQDDSRLLRGKALQEALEWAEDKSLGKIDQRFLSRSQAVNREKAESLYQAEKKAREIINKAHEEEKQVNQKLRSTQLEISQLLEKEKTVNQQLVENQHNNQKLLRRRTVWTITLILISAISMIISGLYAKNKVLEANRTVNIEGLATSSRDEFEISQTDALLTAMSAAKALPKMNKKNLNVINSQELLTVTPILALQSILDNIQEKQVINADEYGVESLQINPKNNQFMTGSSGVNGTAKLWSFQGEQLAQLNNHEGKVMAISFSPQGNLIITTGENGVIRIWHKDNNYNRPITEFQAHSDKIFSINFSSDGQKFVTASRDKTVKIWDISGNLVTELTGHDDLVYYAKFSADNNDLITASEDNTVKIWNDKGQEKQSLTIDNYQIYNIDYSPQANLLVTISQNKDPLQNNQLVSILDLESGKKMADWNHYPEIRNSILGVTISNSGNQLALGQENGNIILLDINRNKNDISESRIVGSHIFKGHSGRIKQLQFTANEKYLISADSVGDVRQWNLERASNNIEPWSVDLGIISTVAVSPDTNFMVTRGGGYPENIKLWNIRDRKIISYLESDTQSIIDLSTNHVTEKIATFQLKNIGKNKISGVVSIWNYGGQKFKEFEVAQGKEGFDKIETISIHLSATGQFLAVIHKSKLEIWNLDNLEKTSLERVISKQDNLIDLDFLNNDKQLVTVDGKGIIEIWDIRGKLINSFPTNQKGIIKVRFSSDGKKIITGSEFGRIKIWERTGKIVSTLRGHSRKITDLLLVPKSNVLFSTASDGTLKVWLIKSQYGQQFAQFTTQNESLESVNFLPNKNLVIAGGGNGNIYQWHLRSLEQLLQEGCDWLKYKQASPDVAQLCS